MKKVLSIMIAITALFALVLGGCKENIPVETITLNKIELTMGVGDRETLTAAVSPEEATDKTVVWSTGDSSVVSVKDGVVTALKPGQTSVTAASADGSVSAVCKVTVVSVYEQLKALSEKEHDKGTLTIRSVYPEGTLTDKYLLEKTSSGYTVSYTLQEFALIEEQDGGFTIPENEIAEKSGTVKFDQDFKQIETTGDKTDRLPQSLALKGVNFTADAFSDPQFGDGTFSATVKDSAVFLGKGIEGSEMKVSVAYSAQAITNFTLTYQTEACSVEIVYQF